MTATRREALRLRLAEIGSFGSENFADDPLWTDQIVINLLYMRSSDERAAVEVGERPLHHLAEIERRWATN